MAHTPIDPQVRKGPLLEIACNAAVLPVFADGSLPPATKELDASLKGLLKREIRKVGFEGEKGHSLWVRLHGSGPDRILLIGVGKRAEFDRDALRDAFGAAAHKLSNVKAETAAVPFLSGRGFAEEFDAAVEGLLLGTYRFDKYKGKPENPQTLKNLLLVAPDAEMAARIEKHLEPVHVRVAATFLARDLVNEPANIVNPTYMEKRAAEIAKEQGLGIRILREEELKKRGMNLILAVGMGSPERPRLVHLEYKPRGKPRRTVALVGKGVTFDSGGLSIKGQDHMYGMKSDMSGAAAVLATMWAVARIKPPVHVHGIFPLVENLPGGHSVKPGDVFIAPNKKSVEIENTDAEGRLILADALVYAKEFKPQDVLDAATLTGACMVALGEDMAGMFSDDAPLANRVLKASARAGEKFWRLPLEKSYLRLLKSDVADLKNVGSRYGGAITAALFLSEFAPEGAAWAHLDIAGPGFISHDWPTCVKGGTGFAVRTFLELISGY